MNLLKRLSKKKQVHAQQQQTAQIQMQKLQVDNQTKLSYARFQEGLPEECFARSGRFALSMKNVQPELLIYRIRIAHVEVKKNREDARKPIICS
jgi:hypothetical protein